MTTNETPDTGTPPAEVEALIEKADRFVHRHDYGVRYSDFSRLESFTETICAEAIATIRTLTARIAELEEALEYEQVIADPYKAEPSEDDGWWVCVMPGVEDGSGPFDTEEEAQAKADEMNAPFREKFQRQLAAAAKAERAKCDEEYRGRIDEARDTVLNCRHALAEGPLEGDPDTVNDILDIIDSIYPPIAADHLEANGRTATDILQNLDELFESEVADEIDAMTTEEINRDVERSGVNIDNLMSRIRGHIDEANGRDTE